MHIREADELDLPGILSIFNEVILSSTAIYQEQPVSLADRREWLHARQALKYPILVAVSEKEIVGFASFGDFRAWPGYRYTVEHSVHVARDCRGEGIGGALMAVLLQRAAALGKHVMVAGVDAANEPSLRFHQRLGFEPVAHFREIGFKFDRWLDLIFLQRFLAES